MTKIRLIRGETYNQRKAEILDNIKVSRQVIRTLNNKINDYRDIRDDTLMVIDIEKMNIHEWFLELQELERFRLKHDLGKDEEWKGPNR